MSKKDGIEVEGVVKIPLPNAMFRVDLANGHEVLARYTGGMRVSFAKLKGLENVVQRIGEDLHSQYLLSFQPLSEATAEGKAYRDLRVRVRGTVGLGITRATFQMIPTDSVNYTRNLLI